MHWTAEERNAKCGAIRMASALSVDNEKGTRVNDPLMQLVGNVREAERGLPTRSTVDNGEGRGYQVLLPLLLREG